MTVKELLDQIAYDSGDDSGEFRAAARRWLNLARAYIAEQHEWRSAFVADATLTTSALTTDGLYVLTDYEHLANDTLYDETNEFTIRHESFALLQEIDVAKSTTSNPAWWGDAGVDENGARQIYLWPVPDGTYTIRFAGYKLLTDLGETDEDLSTDPYFGPISPWAPIFTAGIRYYYDVNNEEDANKPLVAKKIFDYMINQKKKGARVAKTSGMKLAVVRTGHARTYGRFDPSRYSNRT